MELLPQQNVLHIYTIGHSNVPAESIIRLLQAYEIVELVDVRSVPFSQYTPQFNRDTWEQTLREAGINYRFAGEFLGGRPSNPQYYKREVLPEGKTNYLKEVDYAAYAQDEKYRAGIDALIRLAQKRRTVIMCSEEDPQRCHRQKLITQESLLKLGVTVQHIRGNGVLETAVHEPKQQSLFG